MAAVDAPGSVDALIARLANAARSMGEKFATVALDRAPSAKARAASAGPTNAAGVRSIGASLEHTFVKAALGFSSGLDLAAAEQLSKHIEVSLAILGTLFVCLRAHHGLSVRLAGRRLLCDVLDALVAMLGRLRDEPTEMPVREVAAVSAAAAALGSLAVDSRASLAASLGGLCDVLADLAGELSELLERGESDDEHDGAQLMDIGASSAADAEAPVSGASGEVDGTGDDAVGSGLAAMLAAAGLTADELEHVMVFDDTHTRTLDATERDAVAVAVRAAESTREVLVAFSVVLPALPDDDRTVALCDLVYTASTAMFTAADELGATAMAPGNGPEIGARAGDLHASLGRTAQAFLAALGESDGAATWEAAGGPEVAASLALLRARAC